MNEMHYPQMPDWESNLLRDMGEHATPMYNSVGADGWLLPVDDNHVASIMPFAEDTYRERFNLTRDSIFRRALNCPYVETEVYTFNVLPTASLLNGYLQKLGGINSFSIVECKESFITAQQFVRYLRQRQLPQATQDLNYIIHDRALDDHVPGWLIMPEALTEYLVQATTAVDNALEGGTEVAQQRAGTMIAAFDFLTYSLTLYTWRFFNGEHVSPPPPPSLYFIDRFSFDNITGSLAQIAEASAVALPGGLASELSSLVDRRAQKLEGLLGPGLTNL